MSKNKTNPVRPPKYKPPVTVNIYVRSLRNNDVEQIHRVKDLHEDAVENLILDVKDAIDLDKFWVDDSEITQVLCKT